MFEDERKQAIADQEAKRKVNQSAMAAAEASQAASARPAPAARPAVAAKPAPAAATRKPVADEVEPE